VSPKPTEVGRRDAEEEEMAVRAKLLPGKRRAK